jgi:hypothetical protein
VSQDGSHDHWDDYVAAGFTCWPADGGAPISVVPTTPGRIEGAFPFSGSVAFVTSHNPGGPVIEPAENDRRHVAFLADVAAHGWQWWPAIGGDPGGTHQEDGVLLLDAAERDAVALGARFEQDAVYLWRADAIDLVACDESRHDVLGWIATVGTTGLTRPAWAPAPSR